MDKIEFVKNGDYYIPNFSLPENKPIGKYGRIFLKYIKEKRSCFYRSLILNGTPNEHLHNVDALARRKVSRLINLFEADAPDKAINQMTWVGYMNNAKSQVEEIVLSKILN